MECPVCGAPAEDITVQTFDGRSIRCEACGEYDISGTVWDPGLLLKLDPEGRARALIRAKQVIPLGERPMIRGTTFYEVNINPKKCSARLRLAPRFAHSRIEKPSE